jgi:hypothetical protein
VRVVNPVHPLCGQELVVRHLAQFGDVRVLLAEHPAGGVLTLPETELSSPTNRPDALFDARSVRVLLARMDKLVQK